MKPNRLQLPSKPMSRRQFLRHVGEAGAGLLLAACAPDQKAQPTLPATPTQAPTATPLPPSATPTATAIPTVTATPLPPARASVAIGQAQTYDQALIRQQLESMLDGLGGLSDLVKPGARVGIKVNLTGATWWDGEGKPKATEYFVTHPAVAGALGELLRDAGASELYIVDGIVDETCWDKWGYTEMAQPLQARLVNLCKPEPYSAYKTFFVGENWQIDDRFYLHPLLDELDVFVSVAKLKVHSTTGVTLSMKNLVGLAPIEEYRLKETDTNRSALHGSATFDTRMPRVILDLNRARPVHLAVIDGVITCEGGPGPWQELNQIWPGVLVAGKEPLATDAVSTALMGYDPGAPSGSLPFLHGENHLALAADMGLGTNQLSEIRVVGPAIQEVAYKFKPAP